ncbi:hypothetical protein ABMA27_003253 [Loxostege sticticalis]|uniref:DDE Tnp4 domain-containing protein n=1 Tax=Loxostege sticticalis TaxID=481309 RepID=A0ABR3HSH1_LOXSC
MWRVSRGPFSSYFRAWHLLNTEQNEEEQIKRDIHVRNILRKTFDPTNINNREFVKRYRLTKEAFDFLCQTLKEKTTLKASKRVSLELKVICALSFYATGSYQRIVGMGKYLGQTTVSMYVRQVTDALNSPSVLKTFIRFPLTPAEREITRQKFYTKYGFPGVIGCIDGSHFHIFTPGKDIEHLFFCRKHYHSLNVQMICDSDGKIINLNPKYGGATHDAFIWENSEVNNFMQRLHQNNEHTWLLGDSGYPQRPWLMTPITDAAEGTPEAKYTTVHGQTRVIIENTFGRLKNRWRCLSKDRTLHYKPEKCAKIIIACSVLHNIAIDFTVPDSEDFNNHSDDQIQDNFRYIEGTGRDDALIRGRAMRTQLVDRINRLH